ncbi:class I SAM-dependent methyltransferase [Rhizobium tumorigenes]|uniref:class I SAM-dependent methyltransferase n=1 Tax=Rhizobium tumorigenes TaxID=2041385 RepID=UPI00241FA910|nr:class I SAM-dependent methyltransferase [Rhizobium tumorigenes]WFS03273.1 class I SAM-dependent methyltransferase [Rhizobium tumorigenes]
MTTFYIGQPYDDGYVDHAFLNHGGVLRLSGWSRSADTSPPEIENAQHLWSLRYHRDDISDKSNAGVFHDYLVVGEARLSIASFVVVFPFAPLPPYAGLLTGDKVYKRDQIYGTGPSVTFVDSQVAKLITSASGRILDFGCGSGALVGYLRSSGYNAEGVDLDTPKIRRDVIDVSRPHVRFYEGDRLPFKDGAFDWVTAIEVVEHIDNYDAAFADIARVSGGLIMTVPDATGIPRLAGAGVVPWHLLEATHFNFFTPKSLRRALSRHFSHIEIGQLHNANTDGQAWSVNLWAIAQN